MSQSLRLQVARTSNCSTLAVVGAARHPRSLHLCPRPPPLHGDHAVGIFAAEVGAKKSVALISSRRRLSVMAGIAESPNGGGGSTASSSSESRNAGAAYAILPPSAAARRTSPDDGFPISTESGGSQSTSTTTRTKEPLPLPGVGSAKEERKKRTPEERKARQAQARARRESGKAAFQRAKVFYYTKNACAGVGSFAVGFAGMWLMKDDNANEPPPCPHQ